MKVIRRINTEIKDEKSKKKIKISYEHSCHSLRRADQRAISDEQIKYAISNGKEVYKQGFVFYIVGHNILKSISDKQLIKKLKNIVVVVANDSNIIITCYRNNSPFKHIEKKPKRLAA